MNRLREREGFEHHHVYPAHVYPQSQYITLEREEQTARETPLSLFSLSLVVSRCLSWFLYKSISSSDFTSHIRLALRQMHITHIQYAEAD